MTPTAIADRARGKMPVGRGEQGSTTVGTSRIPGRKLR
jgi:hypothetical protein